MHPSWNFRFVTLTSLSHCLVSGPFYSVTSLSQTFRCSDIIPNGNPARPIFSLHTATMISSPSGVPSATITGCTSIRIALLSSGRRL